MPVIIAAMTFLAIAYMVGNVKFSTYSASPMSPAPATSP